MKPQKNESLQELGIEGAGVFFWGPLISAFIWVLGALAVLFCLSLTGCAVQAKMWVPDTVTETTTQADKPWMCHYISWGCNNGK